MMDLKKEVRRIGCVLLAGLQVGMTVQAAPFANEYLYEQWEQDSVLKLWEEPTLKQQPNNMHNEIEEQEAQVSEEEFAAAESILFVGDSRVVGMAEAGGCHYVADIGVGYEWLTGTGASWLEREMAANPQLPVVFCLGVNDLKNRDSYVAYYQSFLNQYPNKEVYFMSVNPVLEEAELYSGYTVSNADIENFNQTLMNTFPERYIDVYGFLSANGYTTSDGLHYDLNTYAGIQQYTLLMINMMRNFG